MFVRYREKVSEKREREFYNSPRSNYSHTAATPAIHHLTNKQRQGERGKKGKDGESKEKYKVNEKERKKVCNLAREGPVASNCSGQAITVYLTGVKWLQAVFLFHYRASRQTFRLDVCVRV